MGILLDTSVITAAERGQLDVHAKMAGRGSEAVALSAISIAELIHGIHRAKSEAQRTRREAFVEQLLQRLEVKPFDFVSARVLARLTADQAAEGASAGAKPRDLMVAAIALSLGWTLATRDERYKNVPGLNVEVW